jgi:hypothetical protein
MFAPSDPTLLLTNGLVVPVSRLRRSVVVARLRV